MEIVSKEHIRGFTPCQHIVNVAEPMETIENSPSYIFDTQDTNIKNILSNNMDKKLNQELEGKAHIPHEIQATLFSSIASRQFDKEVLEMKQDKGFGVDYESVPEPTRDSTLKLF